MTEKKLIAGVGSALMDILTYQDDEFVAATGAVKGGMTLVDHEFIQKVYNKSWYQVRHSYQLHN